MCIIHGQRWSFLNKRMYWLTPASVSTNVDSCPWHNMLNLLAVSVCVRACVQTPISVVYWTAVARCSADCHKTLVLVQLKLQVNSRHQCPLAPLEHMLKP